jgi:hypothetical protein
VHPARLGRPFAAAVLLALVGAWSVLTMLVVPAPARADVGAPSWWSGDCDADHWNAVAISKGWTGAGSHRLGASYLGVPVCGPRRSGDSAPDVQWSRPGWGHFEWECTELAFRFMAQVYGVSAYGANGSGVVRNYSPSYGGNLQTVTNGSLGRPPLPGDIMSFDNTADPVNNFGHVAVVVSTTVDGNGNGSVRVMTQNDTVDGWRTLTLTKWAVGSFGSQVPYGWLHDPAGRGGGTGAVSPDVALGDGPAMASTDGTSADVFARGADDSLWTRHLSGGAASPWTSLGGIIVGAPAAVSRQAGTLDVFVRGSDNALWTRHLENGSWTGWSTLGGVVVDAPGTASAATGTIDVFVKGSDNALWTRRLDSTGWTPWNSLGGGLTSRPSAASAAPGTLDVFIRGLDNAMWTRHLGATGWAGWTSLGSELVTSGPGVVSASAGTLDLFARGADNAMWTRHSTNGAWSPWASLGGIIASPPAVAFDAGVIDVTARGQDGALWWRQQSAGTWGAWTSLGGIVK